MWDDVTTKDTPKPIRRREPDGPSVTSPSRPRSHRTRRFWFNAQTGLILAGAVALAALAWLALCVVVALGVGLMQRVLDVVSGA